MYAAFSLFAKYTEFDTCSTFFDRLYAGRRSKGGKIEKESENKYFASLESLS